MRNLQKKSETEYRTSERYFSQKEVINYTVTAININVNTAIRE